MRRSPHHWPHGVTLRALATWCGRETRRYRLHPAFMVPRVLALVCVAPSVLRQRVGKTQAPKNSDPRLSPQRAVYIWLETPTFVVQGSQEKSTCRFAFAPQWLHCCHV